MIDRESRRESRIGECSTLLAVLGAHLRVTVMKVKCIQSVCRLFSSHISVAWLRVGDQGKGFSQVRDFSKQIQHSQGVR